MFYQIFLSPQKKRCAIITNEMVKKAIAKLKNKRASDRLRWRAEWL